MILESFIGGITTINFGIIGWIVKRQENYKKEFMQLRANDLQLLNLNLKEIKADIRQIYNILSKEK